MRKLELNLNQLKESELECNTEASFFGKNQMEYLGSWVTHNVVKPIDKNISNNEYDNTNYT